MDSSLNELYLKYANEVSASVEDDRYFQYLYRLINAGDSKFTQFNQVLHKVVDERWLTTIEESLDAIAEITEKPRRFIKTTEEVVPVALAKKISADSVRHLSMNTQYIAGDEDGFIQPTKILNVSLDETYDLYENRFIYHLIQRLVTFIDKRTDVIFWQTGDENRSVLKLESKIEDGYEQVEYKLEMKIRNLQSFSENESDNMSIFMRIDRVRRLVMALKNSSFCSLMAGCSIVRSPIQRTNLIMKDPQYRKCYQLWQFLERYDEVGYAIEEKNTALAFDEEYIIQMYTNMIANYAVFKSIMDADERNLTLLEEKIPEPVKPKFVKKIEEEIVTDYNIPDVEIRKVIVEEVTQAQLEAEAKLERETALRRKTEEENRRLNRKIEQVKRQAEEISQKAQEKVEDALKRAEDAKEEARQMVKAQQIKANSRITNAKNQAQAEINKAMEKANKLAATAKEQAELAVNKANREKVKAIEELTAEKEQAVNEITQKAMAEREKLEKENRRAIETLTAEKEREAIRLNAEKEQAVNEITQKAMAEREKLEKESRRAIETLTAEKENEKLLAEKEIRLLKEKLENAEKKHQQAELQIAALTKQQKRLSEKLDKNRFFNRFKDYLFERTDEEQDGQP